MEDKEKVEHTVPGRIIPLLSTLLRREGAQKTVVRLGSDFVREEFSVLKTNFRWRRLGSSLPGLRPLDPSPGPSATPAVILCRTCLQGPRRYNDAEHQTDSIMQAPKATTLAHKYLLNTVLRICGLYNLKV